MNEDKESTIFCVMQFEGGFKANRILNVFFTKEDVCLYFKDCVIPQLKIDGYHIINPYKDKYLVSNYDLSDSYMLVAKRENGDKPPSYKKYGVNLKHYPIPDIMKWCKYDTLVKINPYTYPDYFQYIKGGIEEASGVEW